MPRIVFLLLFLAMPAWAQPPGRTEMPTRQVVAARQVAALFVRSCVVFAGDAAGLRAWAARLELPKLPDPAQAGFLKGVAGLVYDVSNPAGRYVLISHDDGGCVVLAEQLHTGELMRALERELREAALAATQSADEADPEDGHMRRRTYHAARGGRSWTLTIGYGAEILDQAMLSATAR